MKQGDGAPLVLPAARRGRSVRALLRFVGVCPAPGAALPQADPLILLRVGAAWAGWC